MRLHPNGRDGAFGNGTASAVRLFQSNYGLSVDGVVGTATWEKLRSVIRPIQQALVNHGYNTGGVDGIAGDKTYNAVLAFQKANGLTADGMVGNATKAKLGITGSGGGSGTTSATLRVGSNGSLTRYLQRMLNVLGYSMLVDGSFGPTTQNAVMSFQRKYGLEADGIVGTATWRRLFSIYRVPASGTGVQKMINVAKHELEWGFSEDNSNNITPYGEWYGIQGGAWCAMFVSWCAKQAGILETTVPRFAYCPYGVNAYRNKGKFYSRSGGYTPKPGDTIFFWNSVDRVVGHTGIVISVTSTTVTTIEGNAHDAVMQKTYSRSNTYIHGYGCNGGIVTSPDSPSDEVNNAIAKKWRQVINATGADPVPFNFSVENFNKELVITENSYCKVTTEVSADTKLYNSSSNHLEFNISNGELSFKGLDPFDAVETTFGISKNDAALIPLPQMAIAFGRGKGKAEIEASDGWLIFSYVIETEIDVTELSQETIYIKYSVHIRAVPPNEGGSKIAQKVFDEICIFVSENPNTTVILVALFIVVCAFFCPVLGELCLGISAILLIDKFFQNLPSLKA